VTPSDRNHPHPADTILDEEDKPMKARILLLTALFTIAAAVAAFAQGLPSTKPEQVGFSSERLQRLM